MFSHVVEHKRVVRWSEMEVYGWGHLKTQLAALHLAELEACAKHCRNMGQARKNYRLISLFGHLATTWVVSEVACTAKVYTYTFCMIWLDVCLLKPFQGGALARIQQMP